MTWCLGILVLLAWHAQFAMHNGAATATYLFAVVFWIFVGAGALITGLVRLLAGKMKAGAPALVDRGRSGAPATTKGE